jgi:hypothetical protein
VFHTSARRGFELAGDAHEEIVRQAGEIIGNCRGEKLWVGGFQVFLRPLKRASYADLLSRPKAHT